MMLRKGNRVARKEESSSKKASSLFGVRRLWVGFGGGKSLPDSDPTKSPTSPLDYKLFNLANPFCPTPRIIDSPRRSWESDQVRVGLAGALLERSNSSGILLGNRIKINILSPNVVPTPPTKFPLGDHLPSLELSSSKSLARALANRGRSGELRKFRSCFSDVGRSPVLSKELVLRSKSSEILVVDSSMADRALAGSLSTSEIEESEDYTRITTHGPNPKTTHIFGDFVVDSNPRAVPNFDGKESGVEPPSCFVVRRSPEEATMPSLAPDFLSFCHSCRKKLEESADIYMYRGEKAFCSHECREEVISAEEREGNAENSSPTNPMLPHGDEIFY